MGENKVININRKKQEIIAKNGQVKKEKFFASIPGLILIILLSLLMFSVLLTAVVFLTLEWINIHL